MITSKIAANQAFSHVSRMTKSDENARRDAGQGDVFKTAKGEAVEGIKANISAFSAHPLQQFNAEFNAIVKSIRIADKAMGEIEANIEHMASEVEMFLKQYPPYPPGSEERVKYLSRFAMLRKQIDQLSVPPDAGARYIVGYDPGDRSSQWEITVGGQKIGAAIRRQPVHPGGEGLSLPEVTPHMTDEQVAGLHKALGEAKLRLKDRRGALAEDANQVIRCAE